MQTKRVAKRAIAKKNYKDWHDIETLAGEKIVYRMTKARAEERKDVDKLEIKVCLTEVGIKPATFDLLVRCSTN